MVDVTPGEGGPREAFVGRASEMARLTEIVRHTADGVGSAAVLLGEAGMGKTRLLRELAGVAATEGVQVAWGHAGADQGAPTLWPWNQVLRSATSVLDDGEVIDGGPGSALLVDAVPGVAAHLAPFTSLEAPPAHADFYLRDAVTRLLTGVARSRPLLVLLDDLHWADLASLRLAVHLAEHVGGAANVSLTMVASSRTNEAPPLVTELSGAVTAVVLDGLSSTDCGELATAAFGRVLDRDELASLHSNTGGVPLYVDAALRHGVDATGVHPLTSGIEAVATLSEECRQLLGVASVLGRRFEVDTLASVVRRSPAAVRTGLADAVQAGTIVPSLPDVLDRDDGAGRDRPPPGVFEFRHALVAEEFYERLEARRRAELHLSAADAMTAEWEEDRWVTDRARHLLAALPDGDPATAARAAAAAARAAGDRHAHDDAAEWYRRAFDAYPVDDGERCDLLIAGNVSSIHGSGVAEAADGFAAAAALAEALGDPRRHLEALVGLTEARYRAPGLDVDDHTRLLLTRVADEAVAEAGLRAAAAEQLARLETFNGQSERAIAYAQRAAAAAEAAGDSAAAGAAARAMRWATVGPTSMNAKRAASAALLMSGAHLHPEARWDAHQWMMLDAMEAGDRAAMDAEFAACRRVAGELGEPFVTSLTHVWDAGISMMQGRFGDADRAIETALLLMERSGVDPAGVYSQMAVLARDRGEIEGLDELLVGVADAVPESSTTFRAALALVYADQGRDDAARAELDRLGAGGFDQIAVNGVWLTALALCAEACSVLDHGDVAVEILPLLTPYRDRSVVAGGGPYLYLGAVAHHVGSLSTTSGDPEAALEWLDAAEGVHEALGADAWTARTRFERGRALSRTGGASAEATRRELESAAALADRLGMRTLAQRASALQTRPATPTGTFVTTASGWRVEFRSAGFTLPDSKGLRCLHHLLGHVGVDVAATDLVEGVLGERSASAERARVNVTRQIRSAIGRIGDHDAELAQHLTAAIRTGRSCRYEPTIASPRWTLHTTADVADGD